MSVNIKKKMDKNVQCVILYEREKGKPLWYEKNEAL